MRKREGGRGERERESALKEQQHNDKVEGDNNGRVKYSVSWNVCQQLS